MMASVQEYYIVPKEVYDKYNQREESLDDKLDKLPIGAKTNAYNLMNWLKKVITWDKDTGLIIDTDKPIFDYINYSVRGKKKPIDWEEFVPNLWKIPPSLLCVRARRDVKNLTRKHGRKIHKKSLE